MLIEYDIDQILATFVFNAVGHVLRNNIQAGPSGVSIGPNAVGEQNLWQIGSPDPQSASTDLTNKQFLIPTASAYPGTGSPNATIPDRVTYPISPPNIGSYVPVEIDEGSTEGNSPAYEHTLEVEGVGASTYEFVTSGTHERLN